MPGAVHHIPAVLGAPYRGIRRLFRDIGLLHLHGIDSAAVFARLARDGLYLSFLQRGQIHPGDFRTAYGTGWYRPAPFPEALLPGGSACRFGIDTRFDAFRIPSLMGKIGRSVFKRILYGNGQRFAVLGQVQNPKLPCLLCVERLQRLVQRASSGRAAQPQTARSAKADTATAQMALKG